MHDLPAVLAMPWLDPALVERLSELAAKLDGDPDEALRAEFNALANLAVPMSHFQGIYGGMEHEDWVRGLLYLQQVRTVEGVTDEDWVEVARRIMAAELDQAEITYFLKMLEVNLQYPQISDLIYWPGEVSKDFENANFTPAQIIAIARGNPA
ncbi:MAG: hypothetical protein AAGA48_26870 [Myxococcota bacterium]